MRSLMVCNVVPLPQIAEALGGDAPILGGWMTGLIRGILETDDLDLAVAFPLLGASTIQRGEVGGIRYFGFPARKTSTLSGQHHVSRRLERHLSTVIAEVAPDILHIFGTEYSHAFVAAKAFDRPDRTLIHVQGLTSVIAQHFVGALPLRVQRKPAFSNLVRGDLLQQRHRLVKSGELEIATLRLAGHVAGRTDWDRACVARISPEVQYHFCGETLRDEFYGYKWCLSKVEPYSIFMSQSSSPIKGLYSMIEALPDILRNYPHAHLYVSGNDPTRSDGLTHRLKRSSYGKYLAELIDEEHLASKITFLGPLSAEGMRARMLASNVFVSASTIENSSNSLSEARILGVPCVTSFVGGVTSLVRHGVDCFAYQHDAPYMLAYYVCEVFRKPETAGRFSDESRATAERMHDRGANAQRMREIYASIVDE